MVIQNSLTRTNQKGTFGQFIASEAVKNSIKNTCGNNANYFVTTVVSAVANNSMLESCEYKSIVSAALLGQSLKLSCAPALGQFYLVPFANKAVFQLGYRGYIQLAIRSGQYSDIDVLDIREGEYSGRSSNTGKPVFNFITSESLRLSQKVIGYMATFTYLNGFTKAIYMSVEELEAHAKKYSQAHQAYLAGKRKSSLWADNFDAMARKTVLRQLLSRWGMLSVDMQRAIVTDGAVITDAGAVEYSEDREEDAAEVNVSSDNKKVEVVALDDSSLEFNPNAF